METKQSKTMITKKKLQGDVDFLLRNREYMEKSINNLEQRIVRMEGNIWGINNKPKFKVGDKVVVTVADNYIATIYSFNGHALEYTDRGIHYWANYYGIYTNDFEVTVTEDSLSPAEANKQTS